MSSPSNADDEDEVEFVSEAPLRPILECIDLLSEGEDEESLPMADIIEDKVDRQKAHVASTLDRLARKVAVEKQERADKCKAFKEKQLSQKRHGVTCSPENGNAHDAKRCVDMWLKMPGPRPGVINTGFGRRPAPFPARSSTTHICPVVNCNRIYDNIPLLEGHLKRFDHSPCDPTVNLKGNPSELFACVACGKHFETKEAWRVHLNSKVSSSNAEGHVVTQTLQIIVCFACPACYLLFNIRDECLQHMAAKNHFTESIILRETKERPMPIPIPRYAKNRLIALCKDVHFGIRCTKCQKTLNSHMAAQAHFNVQCRQGCAIAVADRTVAEVMKQLQVHGQCSLCCKMFLSHDEMVRHKESTQHEVEVNRTMAQSILQYCSYMDKKAKETEDKRLSKRPESTFQSKRKESLGSPAKRQRLDPSTSRGSTSALEWVCECGLHFSEEATAIMHLYAANQIFHQCGVCGKLMGESSIARLHMSRFHGGAHLTNFLYHCALCKVEMPQKDHIMLHVAESHSGHTFFTEMEVSEDKPSSIPYPKPSTSSTHTALSEPWALSATSRKPPTKSEETWMCRMCEDIFDSKAAVHKHCSDVSAHTYQKFVCGHCPQKFFKEATLRRHCVNEHGGQIQVHYFCGLCDSMQYDTNDEFLEHYNVIHSKDYYHMDESKLETPAVDEHSSELPTTSKGLEYLCPCIGSEKTKEERKATYTQCMKKLARETKCQYLCVPCNVRVPSFAEMKTHVHLTHSALNLDKTFDVECNDCRKSFDGVPSFHTHYHSHHCLLEPCRSSKTDGGRAKAVSTTVKMLNVLEIKPAIDGK
ncbi:E3 SUMO-protein ligase ZNF451 [Aplochiton taeniatus]